ncbi:MAG: hypothetical protein ABI067_17695 [Leifsonia sp.]
MALDATQIRVAGTGAIWKAPVGSVLPTDSTTALDPAYRNLGYAKTGFTVTPSLKTTPVNAWQSTNILRNINAELSRKYGFELEQTNIDTLALAWGGTVAPAVGVSIGTVTIAVTTGVLTVSVPHGLAIGNAVQLAGVAGGAPLTSGTTYYVQSVPTSTTLTLAATLGGAAIPTTTAGTATGITLITGAYVVTVPLAVTAMEYSIVIDWSDGPISQRIVLPRVSVLTLPPIKGDRTAETTYAMEFQELVPATGNSVLIYGVDHAVAGV